jgi:hypothetical protein
VRDFRFMVQNWPPPPRGYEGRAPRDGTETVCAYWPWILLAPGQSFVVPEELASQARTRANRFRAAYGARLGWDYVSRKRKSDGAVRFWRVTGVAPPGKGVRPVRSVKVGGMRAGSPAPSYPIESRPLPPVRYGVREIGHDPWCGLPGPRPGWPWPYMAVGQSVAIPRSGWREARASIPKGGAYRYSKIPRGGYRVWRVA